MSKMTQEQINVDLFDEVKRLRRENEGLVDKLKEIHNVAVKGLIDDDATALETVRNRTASYSGF